MFGLRSSLALLTVALAVGGCATRQQQASPAESAGKPSFAVPSGSRGQINLSQAASTVAEFCRQQFPDVFAGVELDQGTRLAVYRLSSVRLDEAVRSRFSNLPIVFRDAPVSERDLRSLTRRLLGDRDYWNKQGIRIDGAGPDITRGVVIVMTPNAVAARQALRARYGTRVEVQQANIVPAPLRK